MDGNTKPKTRGQLRRIERAKEFNRLKAIGYRPWDSDCDFCGGVRTWCSCCEVWSSTCCIPYGTCMCS